MTPTLYLRPATVADIDLILRWREETATWVADRHGSDQWSVPYPRELLIERADAGETVMAMLSPDAAPIATITVSAQADPDLWSAEEIKVPARYIYKANVVRRHAGVGIGKCLIQWAHNQAAAVGASVIRCDVWSTNQALQDYYRALGFRYLRTVSGTNSGALFEADVVATVGLPIVELPGVRGSKVADK